jgi:hypothetical protein
MEARDGVLLVSACCSCRRAPADEHGRRRRLGSRGRGRGLDVRTGPAASQRREVGGAASTLEDSLPNHHYELGDTGKVATYSDALVTGTVTSVSKGLGVIWRGDRDYTVVDFDDPSADTRTAVVTITVDEATGAIRSADGRVSFRVLVPSLADPDRFAESLAGLGRIAVVLTRDATDFDSTPWRPLMNDNLIGVIADDGSLTLPGLARGKELSGDIQTVGQLLTAARAAQTTTTLATP